MKLTRLLPLLLVLVLFVPSVQAVDPAYDVSIWSSDFEPSTPVYINVTGPGNMTFILRVTTAQGEIVAGKSAGLVNGTYQYTFHPNGEDSYTVTVEYSTGITISRGFLVQHRVTDADLARIYQSIFLGFGRVDVQMADLISKFYLAIAMSLFAAVMSGLMFNHVRTHYSKSDTEFQRFMKRELETPIAKLLRQMNKKEDDDGAADSDS